jgi:hypothetical protein
MTVDPTLDTVMNVLVVAFIGFLIWMYAHKR